MFQANEYPHLNEKNAQNQIFKGGLKQPLTLIDLNFYFQFHKNEEIKGNE